MKRNILLALLGALVLQIGYFFVQLLIGIVQTYFYQPQFAPNDIVLQSEVAFGFISQGTPLFVLASYFLATLVLFMMLKTKESFKKKGVRR